MNIQKTFLLPFPVSKVFEAWVSSETVIPPADRMIVEGEAGGRYELIIDGPEGGSRNIGRFHSVKENHRVVYTWEWNNDGEVTVIDVRFSGSGDGTRVDLLHCGFQKQESLAMHDAEWDSYIEGLTTQIRANGPSHAGP